MLGRETLMRRSLALATLLVIAATFAAPLVEAATDHCGKVSTCCTPSSDDCGMTMCSSEPEPATPAVRGVAIAELELVQREGTVDADVVLHEIAASPPATTRVRLARLETLLI